MKKKIEQMIKNSSILLFLYRLFGSVFFKFCGLVVPVDRNLVLFSSMSGDSFGGSPFVLYKAFIQRYGSRFHYVWAFTKPSDKPLPQKEKVKIDTFTYFILALKAGIWISDVNIERGLSFKRRKNFYINTWHGTGPKSGIEKRKDYNFSKVNLLIVDGQYLADGFIKYYGAKNYNNMLFCGRPREDPLFVDVEAKSHLYKEKYGLLGKTVILWAPTWREGIEDGSQKPEDIFPDFSLLKQTLKDRYVLIYHGHHLSQSFSKDLFDDFFQDFSYVTDINELYFASDILITDYSSALFDFLLLHRPAVLFAPDYEAYKTTRGLIIDLKSEYPCGVAENTHELIFQLTNCCNSENEKREEEFLKKYVSRGENATSTIMERVDEYLKFSAR